MSQSRYSSDELHRINDLNKNRLPPATVVYNLAMYELDRGAENERLFHSAMFDLAELRGSTATQQSRTDSLERTVKACSRHHDNERAISLTGGKHVKARFHMTRANLSQFAQFRKHSSLSLLLTPTPKLSSSGPLGS